MNKWLLLAIIAIVVILLWINREKIGEFFAGKKSTKNGSGSGNAGGAGGGKTQEGVGNGSPSLDIPEGENLRLVRQSNLQRIIQSR